MKLIIYVLWADVQYDGLYYIAVMCLLNCLYGNGNVIFVKCYKCLYRRLLSYE